MLDLQAEKIKDPKIISAIEESRNRVYSMSMIHQKLYQGLNLSSIGMKEYLIENGFVETSKFDIIEFEKEVEPAEKMNQRC